MYTILLALILSLDAQAFSRGRPAPIPSASPSPVVTASPTPAPSPVPVGQNITLVMKDGLPYEATKLAASNALAERILHSQCFRTFLETRKLQETNGLTPKQVVDLLVSTHVTVGVHFYYAGNSTVGYTYPNDPDVYFNRKFHDDYGVRDEASNAMHEWTHKPPMSFDHSYRNPSAYSVPYSVNYAVEKCCSPEGVCKP